MLIELKDGYVKELKSDVDAYGGCETCDYGSSYINEFEIELSSHTINIEVNQMYEHALSMDFMMKLFLQNIDLIKQMTESEFEQWVIKSIVDECNGAKVTVKQIINK